MTSSFPAQAFSRRLAWGRAASIRIFDGLVDYRAFDAAAAMSFYFFVSLLPLLIFLGFVLGRIAVAQGVEAFLAPLLRLIPQNAATVIAQELQTMAQDGTVAPFSLVGFVWLTSSGTHNLMDLLEAASGAVPRPWVRQRAIAVAWNVASVSVITALVWGGFVVGDAVRTSRPGASVGRATRTLIERVQLFSIGTAEAFAFLAVLLVAMVVGLAIFFRVAVAHPPSVRRRIFPGALVGVALWVAVSWGFGVYVSSLAKYAVYYGSLATVAVFLVWLYLTSLVLFIGAEVNIQLEGARRFSMLPRGPSLMPPRLNT